MPTRILHFGTHGERCGIAKYQQRFLDAMEGRGDVVNEWFDVSPNRLKGASEGEKRVVFAAMRERLAEFDALHVQHEFNFFPEDQFTLACAAAKAAGRKLFVTLHTGPVVVYQPVRLHGFTPREIVRHVRRWRRAAPYLRSFERPLRSADLIFVHNRATKEGLLALGIPEARIEQIVLPVPTATWTRVSTEIAETLRSGPDDVVLAMPGFLLPHKGIDQTMRALTLLPARYKLAVLGGETPGGEGYRKTLEALAEELGIADRIHITGYVEEDARLDALIRECDLCVFPYDRWYYANVSSAALSAAFSNHRPLVAYPVGSFAEINEAAEGTIGVADDATPEALARKILEMDGAPGVERSKAYAERFGYAQVGQRVADRYVAQCAS